MESNTEKLSMVDFNYLLVGGRIMMNTQTRCKNWTFPRPFNVDALTLIASEDCQRLHSRLCLLQSARWHPFGGAQYFAFLHFEHLMSSVAFPSPGWLPQNQQPSLLFTASSAICFNWDIQGTRNAAITWTLSLSAILGSPPLARKNSKAWRAR